jgi:hypothetical protein
LTLKIEGEDRRVKTTGDGPVDAIFKAIRELYPHTATLQLFQINAVTEGTDAQATVSVRLEENGRTVTGRGADTDTLVAAAYAYVNALNAIGETRKQAPETRPSRDEMRPLRETAGADIARRRITCLEGWMGWECSAVFWVPCRAIWRSTSERPIRWSMSGQGHRPQQPSVVATISRGGKSGYRGQQRRQDDSGQNPDIGAIHH